MAKCFNGRYLAKEDRLVPCGKCSACRRKKQNQWAARLMQETMTTHMKGHYCEFLTLTYRPSELPLTSQGVPTLQRAAVREWLNKERQKKARFSYYIVGEYGDLYGRPHYHMAIFCKDPARVEEFAKKWQEDFGHVNRKELIPARCVYLAKYAAKSLTKANDKRLKGNQEPEFRDGTRRPALGSEYARFLADQFSSKRGRKVLAAKGDAPRSFRTAGRIYPLSDFTLKKLRKELGIPELHRDRLMDPAYVENYPEPDTEKCPETHQRMERIYAEKARQKLHRSRTQRL